MYREVKKAYAIRSRFIHGSALDDAKLPEAKVLCELMMNYARVSILASLELSNILDKEGLIEHLDDSLLDGDSFKELAKMLNENDVIVT